MSITGYPFDGYGGTDESFEKLQEQGEARMERKPGKLLGPMAAHSFEQDEDKTGSACRFCGLDERNPVHKAGAGPL